MNRQSGAALAIFAFALWGITPLFYLLLPGAHPLVLLGQRMFWSLPLILLARQFFRDRTDWAAVWRDKRSLLCCLAAGLANAVSWGVFTYALTHGQVLAASLGYFINPLCSIALGVLFMSDRLTRAQRIAVILAVLGVGYQIVMYGQVPVLALVMGGAFALYGLIRKFIAYDILTALTVETAWLFPAAVAVMIWMPLKADTATQIYYMLSAPVTLIPLLLFAAAVKSTTLTVVGLAQYIEPSLQFLLAITVFGEAFDSVKAVSFSLIWLGLLCCMYEVVRRQWRQRDLPVIDGRPGE